MRLSAGCGAGAATCGLGSAAPRTLAQSARMRCPNIVFGVSLALTCVGVRADTTDLLGQADVISTIGIARVADEVGDRSLSDWLEKPVRRDLALVAARAAPFAFAPERLVPALARLVCGRDPVLAPEAAVAFVQIAERLRPSELAAREALRSDVRAARASLACAAESRPPVRADLRAASLLLEASLAQLDASQ